MGTESYRPDLLELAVSYAEFSVVVTTAQLDAPGPQILYVNPAFTKMTGYSAAEVIGRTPRILQGPATDRETLDRLRADLSAGRDFTGRATNYRRDGSEFELEWIISHLRDSDGNTTHFIAIQRDITGKNEAQKGLLEFDQELQQTGEQLLHTLQSLELAERGAIARERLAALGEMAAGVAHDLNNSLSPMLHVMELLERSSNLSSDDLKLVSILRQSASHASSLVQNLRHFYQAGQENVRRELINLSDLVTSVREITRTRWDTDRRSGKSPIRFELLADESQFVRANLTELRQVLINLVFNAVDSMPSGGTLTITVSHREDDAVIEISDTGCGMPAEVMDRCFEPYFTTKKSGSGFGLSVCHGIVTRYDGRIGVASVPDQGTSFRIYLPQAPMPVEPDTAPASGLKILYIDDTEIARLSTRALLLSLGHEVELADSGETGLKKLSEDSFDVLITDMQMPGMSGADVTRNVRLTNPGMPIVIVTGSSRGRIEAELGAEAADAIVEKPFERDEIEALLNRLTHAS